MFLGMSFAIWLPWILGFGALLVDWYIGLVVWAKEDEKDKKELNRDYGSLFGGRILPCKNKIIRRRDDLCRQLTL